MLPHVHGVAWLGDLRTDTAVCLTRSLNFHLSVLDR